MNSTPESGGVGSTTRARSSTSRPAGYSAAPSDCTDGGSVSGGGGWYSVKPTAPTEGGNVASSTGPAALNTYTPGVTMNAPAAARSVRALPAAIGCTLKDVPRSGSVTVIGQARLMARVTTRSGLGGSKGSRTGTASG